MGALMSAFEECAPTNNSPADYIEEEI
jgi:hypothetical protein